MGVLNAVQSRLNGGLAVAVGSPATAGFISFGTGLLLLSIVVAAIPAARRGVSQGARALGNRILRPWQVLGGLCGGLFVMAQSGLVPAVGVAAFTVAVVAGHSGSALVVDRFGWSPRGALPISTRRLVGAGLAVLAALVAALGSLRSGPIAPTLFGVAVAVGCLVALQQAWNGHVTVASGSAVAATWLNFLIGFCVVGLAVALSHAIGFGASGSSSEEPWWLYLGGVVGVLFIFLAAWAVPHIGVLMTALLAIAGQLVTAMSLDVLAPASPVPVSVGLVVGVVIAGIAAVIGSTGRVLNR